MVSPAWVATVASDIATTGWELVRRRGRRPARVVRTGMIAACLVAAPAVVRTVALPDPGILLTAQSAHIQAFLPPVLHPAELAGFFKTPSLWGVKHTAPYFHDNSAKTLREVVDHYGDVFFVNQPIAGQIITLTEQDRQDIVAFLERF